MTSFPTPGAKHQHWIGNFSFWPEAGTRFTLMPETTRRIDKIYETIVLGHWTIGSPGRWSLREGKWLRYVLWLHQLTAWEAISRPKLREVEPKESSEVLLSWGDRAQALGGWGTWNFWGSVPETDFQRSKEGSWAAAWSTHAWKETAQGQGKHHK